MDVTIGAKPLLDALRSLKSLKGLPHYTPPILDCVHLAAKDGGLMVRRSNLTLDLSLFLEGTVGETGGTCVNLIDLLGIVKGIPTKESVTLLSVEKELVVTAPGMSARLPMADPDEYPLVSEFYIGQEFVLDCGAARNALDKVLSTISTDNTRGCLTGMYLAVKDGTLTLAASDAYRLSYATLDVPGMADGHWLLPGSGIKALLTVLPKTGQVRFGVKDSPDPILVSTTNLECWISTMPDQFVNYQQIIPKTTKPYLTCSAPNLARVVATATTRGDGCLILESQDMDKLRVSRVDHSASWEIPATVETPLRIGLSGHYLADLCKAVGKTDLTLHKEGAWDVEATCWAVADDPSWHYYLMPITIPEPVVKAADEAAEVAA